MNRRRHPSTHMWPYANLLPAAHSHKKPNPNRIQHQFHFMHIHDPIGKFMLLHAQTNMQWQRETRNRRACLVGELGIQGPVIVQRVDLGTEAANCGIERLGSLAKRLLFARVF